jgi:hypothetical protein
MLSGVCFTSIVVETNGRHIPSSSPTQKKNREKSFFSLSFSSYSWRDATRDRCDSDILSPTPIWNTLFSWAPTLSWRNGSLSRHDPRTLECAVHRWESSFSCGTRILFCVYPPKLCEWLDWLLVYTHRYTHTSKPERERERGSALIILFIYKTPCTVNRPNPEPRQPPLFFSSFIPFGKVFSYF